MYGISGCLYSDHVGSLPLALFVNLNNFDNMDVHNFCPSAVPSRSVEQSNLSFAP